VSDLAPVTHIVGPEITIGGRRMRQRCAWCGAVLLDYDLANVAVQVEPGEQPEPPAVYPYLRLVRITGGGGFRLNAVLDDTDQLPDDACARVDDEVTG
jgi:hypothetical protein